MISAGAPSPSIVAPPKSARFVLTPGTAKLAEEYLLWFIPAMALQFPLVSMSAALATGGWFANRRRAALQQ